MSNTYNKRKQGNWKNNNKENELKIRVVESLKSAWEEKINALKDHDQFLEKLLPEDFVKKAASGHTAKLPDVQKILSSLTVYLSAIGVRSIDSASQSDEEAIEKIISALAKYGKWKEKKITEAAKELEKGISNSINQTP